MGFVVTHTLFSAQAILASASYTSAAVVLGDTAGSFSLQFAVTGDGTAKVELLCSNDGTNYVTPEGLSAILTGKTKTSGNYLTSFSIPVCHSFKVKVTETGGAQPIAVTGTLAMI